MRKLSPLDIAVFAGYMLVLIGVGLWFARQKKDLKTYLLADQNVHWIIVAISVLAALFSGITYLGAPAESFFYDLTYLWVVASFFIATPVTTLIFLPFFRNLNLYTAYEYLERRFDSRLRWIASGLFLIRVTFYVGLAIYAPALAISEITDLPVSQSVLLTGAAATIYTALGGMKAVIWTDTIQFIVLCGGIVLILGFALYDAPQAWPLAAADGKTKFFNFDPNPTVRLTVWGAVLGGVCNNLVQMVTDQISVQRYLTAPSLRDSQKALWLKLWVTLPLVSLFYFTGTVLYGYYKAHPERVPLLENAKVVPELAQPTELRTEITSETGIKNDRILPYFVVNELPPPLPGLLIAAIFGATMAVVSAGINALATASLMDFGPLLFGLEESERSKLRLARWLTVGFGVAGTLLALFVMSKLGTLLQATNTIMGLFGGPLLGIFFLGVLSRRANGSGALIGAVGGAVVGCLVAFSSPVSEKILPKSISISFMWISFSAVGTTIVLGLLASLFFGVPGPEAQALVFRKGTLKQD